MINGLELDYCCPKTSSTSDVYVILFVSLFQLMTGFLMHGTLETGDGKTLLCCDMQ